MVAVSDALTTVQVKFDARVYGLAAIKKAAYRYLKSFSTEIVQEGDAWVCTLTFPTAVDAKVAAHAEQELRTEVLDQDLRHSISRETEPLRNAILALAFSRTGLQGSE